MRVNGGWASYQYNLFHSISICNILSHPFLRMLPADSLVQSNQCRHRLYIMCALDRRCLASLLFEV